ncbi:MAG: hypothetical protein ACOCXG_05320, partial [Nanoarchaeota archaeon]
MTKKKYPMVLNWKEILLYLFENKPQIIFSHKTNKDKYSIGKHTYDDSELKKFIMPFFVKLKYFDYKKIIGENVENVYTITKEGISVALDLQKHSDNIKDQDFKNKVSASVLIFTAIMAIEPLLNLSKFLLKYDSILH